MPWPVFLGGSSASGPRSFLRAAGAGRCNGCCRLCPLLVLWSGPGCFLVGTLCLVRRGALRCCGVVLVLGSWAFGSACRFRGFLAHKEAVDANQRQTQATPTISTPTRQKPTTQAGNPLRSVSSGAWVIDLVRAGQICDSNTLFKNPSIFFTGRPCRAGQHSQAEEPLRAGRPPRAGGALGLEAPSCEMPHRARMPPWAGEPPWGGRSLRGRSLPGLFGRWDRRADFCCGSVC